jgi:predicted XRE-type DNA-binding protein
MDDIIHGTTNVYADLGLPDADIQLLKAQLVSRLADRIESLGLCNGEAARHIGIPEAELADILRGRFRQCSPETLTRYLTALASEVNRDVALA